MDSYFMIDLVNVLISGLLIGSLYAIMALGLTIIHGVIRIFNFCHGGMSVLGGYLTFMFLSAFGFSLIPSIILSCLLMFGFGLILYRTSIAFLVKKPNWEITSVIFLLGLGILMENLILQLFGPRVKEVPLFFEDVFEFGSILIDQQDVVLVLFVIIFVLGLNLFFSRTWLGRSIRAVAQDMNGAKVVGINANRTLGLAFGLASAVTGLAGILLATKYYLTPQVGWDWMFKGFIIVVFGGLGTISGAIFAGLFLGLVESLITFYGSQSWVWPAWFVIFLIVLLIKPEGLFGRKSASY
ncbi:MAG: branched-chain amino acid ABC transporter permease [Deltaproteobacteria bacterium]|jgi:branched-chain amino acid transport system permease protein|nr:branched-chain amino acid ABC transporter permease [Deltaproteobacteria bacterium]MBT4644540.1 branched-chain amino acid ABC transporter permease [Deltaproteobacteria bacterium]MBT6501449.1 branched-chain amino acid ABC transporter permease [Deltaproteobacteria bacterium]MBT7151058.1 branched-chain amino acid ABC transporter permease [Deltaproteobacteria bacterium]MBT7713700.1 branched-chain amino acid ABC transporter permease [Deltaproteobacteria bacterium]